MVKTSKRTTPGYYLAVAPGEARLDRPALKTLAGGTDTSAASTDRAEALAGSVSGTTLPFSCSLALDTCDYLRRANPHLYQITTKTQPST